MSLSELHGASTHLVTVAVPLLLILLVLRRLRRGGTAARAWEPWVMGAALVGILASGATGLLVRERAQTELRGSAYDLGAQHFWLGFVLLALLLAVAVVRHRGRRRPRWAAAGIAVALAATVAVTAQGYLGGRMTYEHGVGVQALGQGRQTAVGASRLAVDLASGMDAERAGARAYQADGLGCASCHGFDALGERGPRLAGGTELGEFREAHAGGLFPPAVVTDEQFAAVDAFLRTLE